MTMQSSSPQHTPGPWRFDKAPHDDMNGWILEADAVDDDPCVAYLEGVGNTDLALLLAAPDLLAVVEVVALWPHADGECLIVDMARAALKKATGYDASVPDLYCSACDAECSGHAGGH